MFLRKSVSKKPFIYRKRTRSGDLPDVTLLNMNPMLVNSNDMFDQQAYIPLGILYIASYLEKEGINVEFADFQTFNKERYFDADLLLEALKDPSPILGISCMSNLLPFTINFCRKFKKVYPDRKIVLGGVGPSPVAKEILEAFPFIDSVVVGEGEKSMLRIMQGDFCRNPESEFVKDLNSIPFPAYHLLDFKKYDAAPSIITSRGCPFSCTFCTEPFNFSYSGTRFREVDKVLEEIELLHSLSGFKMFLFQDDILPLDRKRFRRLMEGLRKLSFRIQWKCFSRIDLISEDIIKEMVESGCVQIRYGIESGCNRTLEIIKKGITIEQAFHTVCKSLIYFPSVHVSFIWGYPFEDIESVKETMRWVNIFEKAGATVLLFELAPLPGSEIYKSNKNNLVFDESKYSFFVVTGHEKVLPDRYIHSSESVAMVEMIREYPAIFPGFYRYRNSLDLEMTDVFENYKLRRRTKVRNKFDA